MDPPDYATIAPHSPLPTMSPLTLTWAPNSLEYVPAQAPATPTTYSFSPISPNAMVLVPPPSAPDSRPVYHISVSMSCFTPLSVKTTIRRGATEYGIVVGDFSTRPAGAEMMCLRGYEINIDGMLADKGRAKIGWRGHPTTAGPTSKALFCWECEKAPALCTLKDSPHIVLAKFWRNFALRRPGRVVSLPELQIFPEGQPYFDDILISLMILERKSPMMYST